MRFKGRQGRFLVATIGGWVAARARLLWPAAPVAIGGALVTAALLDRGLPLPVQQEAPPFRAAPGPPSRPPHAGMPTGIAPAPDSGVPAPVPFARLPPSRAGHRLLEAFNNGDGAATGALLRLARYAPARGGDAAPTPPPLPPPASPRAPPRLEGEAYLFLRPGSGRAVLAPGGSLGGSQVAARLARPLDRAGRLAIVARAYAPLHAAGAEAAVGLDWRPLSKASLRLSVERRIGLDIAGRHAWSAYVAGGDAWTLPGSWRAEGYAQAGVVGANRRDLFADGAVRLGRRIDAGPIELIAGGGAWGAAQPGVARLDLGPRLAAALPVDGHRLSLALEGRFRLAGRASPGSGAALTLAADF